MKGVSLRKFVTSSEKTSSNPHQRSRHFAKTPNSKLIKTRQIMQTNTLDLSILSLPLQQELIDFYQFLCEKHMVWYSPLFRPLTKIE
jgi:hypothetical protein